MKIKLNNKEVETQCATVAQLAAEMQLPESGVAVAIDNEMVPRSEWPTRAITDGDDIIILKAFAGG